MDSNDIDSISVPGSADETVSNTVLQLSAQIMTYKFMGTEMTSLHSYVRNSQRESFLITVWLLFDAIG